MLAMSQTTHILMVYSTHLKSIYECFMVLAQSLRATLKYTLWYHQT